MQRKAVTFIEATVVVIVLGIIAAMMLPRISDATDTARTSSLESKLADIRAAIKAYRTNAILAGAKHFPSTDELLVKGAVTTGEIGPNPFTNISGVQAVTAEAAAARAVTNADRFGWNYYVDNSTNPPTAVFYANCEATTSATDSSGKPRHANEL